MRYPGGSEADTFHRPTSSITPGQGSYANHTDTFDNFMHVVSAVGRQAMSTVNYGSKAAGTADTDPQKAAGWVEYANRVGPYYTRRFRTTRERRGPGTRTASSVGRAGRRYPVSGLLRHGDALQAREAGRYSGRVVMHEQLDHDSSPKTGKRGSRHPPDKQGLGCEPCSDPVAAGLHAGAQSAPFKRW